MGKEGGMKAEYFFADLLKSKKISYEFVDDWYDFLVKDKYKVEIKSCQLTVKRGKVTNIRMGKYRIGRFDFSGEDNRKKMIKENIWVGLVVRHRDQFIMYGFVKAKKLNGKRYLSIHQARDLKSMSFEDWVLELYGD